MVHVYWQTVMTTPSGYLTFLRNCTVGMLYKVYQKWYLIICYFSLYINTSCFQQWHNWLLLFHSQNIHTCIYFLFIIMKTSCSQQWHNWHLLFHSQNIHTYIHIFFYFQWINHFLGKVLLVVVVKKSLCINYFALYL